MGDALTDSTAAPGEQRAAAAPAEQGAEAGAGLDLSSPTTALVSAAIAAVLTWAFTRSIERAKQQEAFKVALVQKRVGTALRVQDELDSLIGEFMGSAADSPSGEVLRNRYLRIRRKIATVMGRTAFTNPLLYGYVNGLLRENFLHDVEERNRGAELATAFQE